MKKLLCAVFVMLCAADVWGESQVARQELKTLIEQQDRALQAEDLKAVMGVWHPTGFVVNLGQGGSGLQVFLQAVHRKMRFASEQAQSVGEKNQIVQTAVISPDGKKVDELYFLCVPKGEKSFVILAASESFRPLNELALRYETSSEKILPPEELDPRSEPKKKSAAAPEKIVMQLIKAIEKKDLTVYRSSWTKQGYIKTGLGPELEKDPNAIWPILRENFGAALKMPIETVKGPYPANAVALLRKKDSLKIVGAMVLIQQENGWRVHSW